MFLKLGRRKQGGRGLGSATERNSPKVLLLSVAEADQFPEPGFVRLVERQAARIPDPVERLRFIRSAQIAYRPPLHWWWYTPAGRRTQWFVPRFVCLVLAGALALRLIPWVRGSAAIGVVRAARPVAVRATRSVPAESPGGVWLVEKTAQSEVFSNGLRIEIRYTTATRPRAYRAWARLSFRPSEWRSDPAGIVFHTSESRMAPFEAEQNASLKRNGAGLLDWVRQTQCYHFVIDRFGRVFRVVAESDVAHHAGNSVWADDEWVYVNLNESFLGVSFEAASQAGDAEGDDEPPGAGPKSYSANPAQIHAARILTEMLRARYRIPAANCVTHAQVSVNPQNMAIGYHTDWAGDFPFRELGLGEGYDRPLASIAVFGFTYNSAFLHTIGRQVWGGMLAADEQILKQAAAAGMTPVDYRRRLQKKYREIAAELRAGARGAGQAGER